MWELIGGFNPLLALPAAFNAVLNMGGLSGPPVTGDPGEIVPQSVQPQPTMADQMAAFGGSGPVPAGVFLDLQLPAGTPPGQTTQAPPTVLGEAPLVVGSPSPVGLPGRSAIADQAGLLSLGGVSYDARTRGLERRILRRYLRVPQGLERALRRIPGMKDRPITLSRSKALTPYKPPSGVERVAFALGTGARFLGTLGLLLYPRPIAPGTLSEEQRMESIRRYDARAFTPSPGGADISGKPPVPYGTIEDIETQMARRGLEFENPGRTPFGDRVWNTAGDFGREWLQRQLDRLDPRLGELTEITTDAERLPSPATGVRTPLPGMTPAQQTIPAGRSWPSRLNSRTLQYAMLAGLGVGLLGNRRSRNAPGTTSPTTLGTGMAPQLGAAIGASPSTVTYLTGIESRGVASRQDSCHCKPKRRGPARRCLERGTVAWKTGRYKGRAAGSKCIRYAT
jgi:hypothetical protein